MATALAVIATIFGLIGILIAWLASRQQQDLSGRLARTNERIDSLHQEMTGEQQKFEREKRRLQAELVKIQGDNGVAPDPDDTGELSTPQIAPLPIKEITPAALKTRLDQGDEVVVVDMRQPYEYNAGHIPGAINMFVEHIPARMSELPQDKDIVFQCWSGNTSLQASAYLIDSGWPAERVASLSGGIAGWTQTNGIGSLVKD